MRRYALVFTLFCVMLSGAPQTYADDSASPAPETSSSSMRTGFVVTGGCVGGAILGTVVPIFGNLIGCAAGGLIAWWVRRPAAVEGASSLQEKTRQPAGAVRR